MAKKIDDQSIWDAQIGALHQLECNITLLEKAAVDLKQKVNNKKLEHNYSVNEDCLTYAVKVWQNCLRLNELKKLQWELEGRDKNGKKNSSPEKPKKKQSRSSKKNKSKK